MGSAPASVSRQRERAASSAGAGPATGGGGRVSAAEDDEQPLGLIDGIEYVKVRPTDMQEATAHVMQHLRRRGRKVSQLANQRLCVPPDGELSLNTPQQGKCYGCGVGLQISTPGTRVQTSVVRVTPFSFRNVAPLLNRSHTIPPCRSSHHTPRTDAPGYVKREKYEPKARHKQLDQLCCARCGALANGAMVNAVIGASTSPPHSSPADATTARTPPSRAAQLARAPAHRPGRCLPAGQGTEGRRPGLVTAEQLRAHLSGLRNEKALVVMVVDALDFQARVVCGGGLLRREKLPVSTP